jgi:hypothetical protein
MRKRLNPLYVLGHPFDGYQEIKTVKNGSFLAANVIIILWFAAVILQRQLTNFRFNENNLNELNIFYIALSTIVLFIFWCAANWSFCTLLDGEGKLKEIWISTAYAIQPYVASILIVTVLSHYMILEEKIFLDMIRVTGIIWSAFLVFIALQEMHQYNFSKTIMSVILTLFGILFIVFICILVFTLFQQIIVFFVSIYNEILFRI